MENNKFNPEECLTSNNEQAKKLLNNVDELERVLQRLEKKLATIPYVGDKLSEVPVMISLVRSYIIKEYTDIPVGTIVAIVSALIYVLSPADAIPDVIPGIGYLDDAAVIAVCWKLAETDVREYQKWRKENNKVI